MLNNNNNTHDNWNKPTMHYDQSFLQFVFRYHTTTTATITKMDGFMQRMSYIHKYI